MSVNKKEAAAYKARWRLVQQAELEETRRTSADVKYRQFLELLKWTRQLGWTEYLSKDDPMVRERWRKLREAYNAQAKKAGPADRAAS